MATAKKINPNAQAPELIRKIQSELKWTQTNLENYLGLSQQTVSNYLLGYVDREQYGVIKKLENILAEKLPPPSPEEVIEHEEQHGAPTGGDDAARKTSTKKASVSPIPKGRNQRNRTAKKNRS